MTNSNSEEVIQSSFKVALTRPRTVLAVDGDAVKLLGFSSNDFLNGLVTLQNRIHPEDKDIENILFSSEASPETDTFTIRMRHADGGIRCIRGYYTKTINSANGATILELLLQDSKSLWQKQEDQTMVKNFKSMMENTTDYIYFKDSNHIFTGASETIVSLTYPIEHWSELLGKTFYDVFPEKLADNYYRLEKQVYSGSHIAHEVQEISNDSGKQGWVDNRAYPIKNDKGDIVGLFGIARDITATKLAESLTRSETKFRTLFESSSDAILMLDENGFFDCNDAAVTLFGLQSREELIRYHPIELSPPVQLCGTKSSILAENHIKTAMEEGSLNFEWLHQRADSEKVFIADITLTALTLDSKLVLQTTVRDISDRKRSEDVLRVLAESSTNTDDFMKVMVRQLALSMNTRYAVIAQLTPDSDNDINTLAVWADGNFIDNFSYALKGTPCEFLLSKNQCFYQENIHQLFPEDPWLADIQAESYIGLPLKSRDGKVLGLVALIDDKPMVEQDQAFELLNILATRAGIELERKESSNRRRLAYRVFNSSQEGVIVTNANKEIIDVNPAFTHITGYSYEEVIGQNPRLLSSGKQGAEFYQDMWQAINANGHWKGEVWNRKKSGELYAELLTLSVIKNELNQVTNYVGSFTDITDNIRQQEKLNRMAHYDVLTGLPNRVLFNDRFRQSIAHSKRSEHHLAVCFLDLDNFKPVNDNYGHEIGDKLLVEVAQRIKDSIREDDTVSRQGGDEFALLLNDIESYEQCELALERILYSLSQPYLIDKHSHKVTASIGVTLYPDNDEDIETLIRHADNAMYQAKLAGKHRYHIFDSEMDRQLTLKHHKLAEIQQALINGEFSLYYQPKVNMVTGEVFGVEALLRWVHPDKGLIPPLAFLPLIDNTDLELQVGDWVIAQALMQMDSWLVQGIKLEVSVNIASHHLLSNTFFTQLDAVLAQYPAVDASDLQLEILESSALSDLHVISQIIKTCQEVLGVNIALDDFGTGYSSLAHLRSLTANTIKIDQSFIRDMLDDPNDYTLVNGVIGLAESFGRKIIAEGVETTEHGLMLLVMGCEEAQGYGIARPMPADEVLNWLSMYKPNKEWIDCGGKVFTNKENKTKLFRLITEHWLRFFIANIQSQPQDIKQWPIMNGRHDHCGYWLKREKRDRTFTTESLRWLEVEHDEFHAVAQAIQHTYLEGDADKARKELPKLQIAFDKMINVVGG